METSVNNKCKAFTSLEQSKKLAEVLPIESADMYYDRYGTPDVIDNIVTHKSIKTDKYQHLIPCWSLACLLGVLPTMNDEFEPQLHRSLDKYRCTYEGEEDSSGLWRVANNPIDACYEMILKLHELNLL